jgi:hypothetical protein
MTAPPRYNYLAAKEGSTWVASALHFGDNLKYCLSVSANDSLDQDASPAAVARPSARPLGAG